MIMICGSDLKQDQLPLSDVITYVVENNIQLVAIKLRATARKSDCLAVYINREFYDKVELTDDVVEKVTIFDNDDDLLDSLNNSGVSGNSNASEPVVPENEDIIFESKENTTSEQIQNKSDSNNPVIESADFSFVEKFITMPNASEDTDSLKLQLANSRKIVDQQQGIIQELESNLDDLYKTQEDQLLDMRSTYENRVDEVNNALEDLKNRLITAESANKNGFLRFAKYGEVYKAEVREGFSKEELGTINTGNSKVYAFACGGGGSLHSMLGNVVELMKTKKDLLIVDFTGDYFMNAKYQISSSSSSMMLADRAEDASKLVVEVEGVSFIPTSFYNDIALLLINWVEVLNKLAFLAHGRTIIFLFNSINSFSVKYTVSKLSTALSLYVFVKSNPIILSSLTGDIAFIPSGRFNIVAMDYLEVVNKMLKIISERHSILAFKDAVNWSKLGL